jgi:integration host factor subunit beta
VRAGEKIELRGFGSFHVRNYEGYEGRNPKTGAVVPVRPKRGLLFRTGRELQARLNPQANDHAARVSAESTPSSDGSSE